MYKKHTVILGGGLAGLSTAYHLKANSYKIFEKDSTVGGLCRTEYINGFNFDHAGHLLHIRRDYILELVRKLTKNNLFFHTRRSFIFSNGVYTKYPFQCNLYGLPLHVVRECILGAVEAKYTYNKKIENFDDWINASMGKGIAKYFMHPYNEKLWKVKPKEMTTDWLSAFVPKPNLEEIINGALQDNKNNRGYNAHFRYPNKGGIEKLPKSFLPFIKNIEFKKEAVEIWTKLKKIIFTDGTSEHYEVLVSTIPLPCLIEMIHDHPLEIIRQKKKLKHTSVLAICIGIDRPNITNKHWIYYPESDYVFYRVGFPMNLSPNMAPNGTSSICAEVSYTKEKSIDKTNIIERTINDLKKANLINGDDNILVTKLIDLEYAYVIYDRNRKKALSVIQNFLKHNHIYSIGRYGAWEYSTMEQAILDGKKIAEK